VRPAVARVPTAPDPLPPTFPLRESPRIGANSLTLSPISSHDAAFKKDAAAKSAKRNDAATKKRKAEEDDAAGEGEEDAEEEADEEAAEGA